MPLMRPAAGRSRKLRLGRPFEGFATIAAIDAAANLLPKRAVSRYQRTFLEPAASVSVGRQPIRTPKLAVVDGRSGDVAGTVGDETDGLSVGRYGRRVQRSRGETHSSSPGRYGALLADAML